MIDGIALRPTLRRIRIHSHIRVDQMCILCVTDKLVVFRLNEMPRQSAQYVMIDITLASPFR
jgi:hypothetical protein